MNVIGLMNAPVPNLATSKAFCEAGLAHGGASNGAPGLRPENDDRFFATYVINPDEHDFEAVFRR